MKILVTGSNGLLGQKLTDLLRTSADIELVATAIGSDRYPTQEGYTYESLDITKESEVNRVISLHRPDVVINTAGKTNVDECETDHKGCDELNIAAVKYLALACNESGAHFIHVSTDFIFDGSHGPVSETEVPKPLSYYGNAKLKGEEMAMKLSKNWTVIRAILVYGVVNDMSRSNVVLWVKKNLELGKDINVVSDQFRTPTLAEDLARGCLLAAKKKAKGIYHIGGGEFMSIFDLAVRVADHWKLDKSLLHISGSGSINQPAKRPPITGFVIDKARKELGYEPHSFEEGLAILDSQLNRISK